MGQKLKILCIHIAATEYSNGLPCRRIKHETKSCMSYNLQNMCRFLHLLRSNPLSIRFDAISVWANSSVQFSIAFLLQHIIHAHHSPHGNLAKWYTHRTPIYTQFYQWNNNWTAQNKTRDRENCNQWNAMARLWYIPYGRLLKWCFPMQEHSSGRSSETMKFIVAA